MQTSRGKRLELRRERQQFRDILEQNEKLRQELEKLKKLNAKLERDHEDDVRSIDRLEDRAKSLEMDREKLRKRVRCLETRLEDLFEMLDFPEGHVHPERPVQ